MKLQSHIIKTAIFVAMLCVGCGKSKPKDSVMPNPETQAEQPKSLPEGAIAFDYARHLYFDVMLRDSIPAKMIFDTGNTNILLDLDFYNEHIADYDNLIRTVIQGAGNSLQGAYRDVNSWKYSIGRHSQTEKAATVLNLRKILGHHVDGMFGMEFMKGKRVEINYADEYMRILPQEEQPTDGYRCIKCEWIDQRESRLLMPMQVTFTDGSSLAGKFLVDLGAGDAVAFTSGLARKINLRNALKEVHKKIYDTGGVGGSRTDYIFTTKSISVAGYKISNVNASYSGNTQGSMADDSYDGLVGNALLERFDVIFDFAKCEIWLRPNENFEVSAKYDSGMTLTPQKDCWVVNGLIEGGNAHQAGVRRGEQIISINGLAPDQVNIKRLQKMNASKEEWKIAVKRNNTTTEIVIQKEKL